VDEASLLSYVLSFLVFLDGCLFLRFSFSLLLGFSLWGGLWLRGRLGVIVEDYV